MTKIVAWKCEADGKLFETEKAYRNHMQKLAKARKWERDYRMKELARIKVFKTMRETVRNARELEWFIITNWEHFCINADTHGFARRRKPGVGHPALGKIKLDIHWSASVSNSHSCPIGGETNWGGYKTHIPRGHPGWMGTLSYSMLPVTDYDYGSECWKQTGINSGTGGGGTNGYSYAVELFEADWPAMDASYKAAAAYRIVTDSMETVDNIAASYFDTAEKVELFNRDWPKFDDLYQKAKTWRIVKNDKRRLGDVIRELNEQGIGYETN